ncbi:uncharacterized protein LOC141536665 isoform X2 [Cotesia typhae]|uniref:uncharacterized protein LOC141536665 isoform X2 n=1 Tax=Cotesia typhae TaxID=2053667 RepID=UPI003D68C234
METESRRKGPRSPSADSDDSSRRRRSRKYDRDRSPSPRRSRYRRSRSRDRRSGSRERRRKDPARNSQDWTKPGQNQAQTPTAAAYVPPVLNQYQAPPPPNTAQPPPQIQPYNQGYNYNYNYNQGYEYGYPQSAGYRSDYPPPNWQGGQVPYNNQPAPVPPAMTPAIDPPRPVETAPTIGAVSRPEESKKEAEKKQQQATLLKQREEYVRKTTTLQRELEILRQQCDEIGKEDGRENRIVKENQKLQVEIQNKMKSIHNVIDMLTGIIGDKATVDDLRIKYKSDAPLKRGKSPKEDFPKAKLMESPTKSSSSEGDREAKAERERKLRLNEEDSKPTYNFVHYDPEMHWCKVCDIFPKTAKEYLNHLHSNEHKETCLERKIVDMPWHKRNGEGTEKEVPYYPGLPTKRTPIKGLQFFSPATAWYCRLCDSWIGDLHCASLHLKSKRHSENFCNYVDQNPHWETDWMADREKAFSDERQKQMQLELQKQKEDEPSAKPKKSKKSKKNKKKSKKRKNKSSNSESSSDSENSSDQESDQDTSKSIRVAMRNKMKASTQAILNEEIDYHGIKLKGHWSQVAGAKEPEYDDRALLNSIRDKLKAKQEEEMKRRPEVISVPDGQEIKEGNGFSEKPESTLEAWGPKEPPKPFWIKKDEDKAQPRQDQGKSDIPKLEEIPKPHMGFWTKQQVNMPAKAQEKSLSDREDDRERDRERDRDQDRDRDRKYDHKDDRDRKYDRRDHGRYDSYDRRARGGRDRDRDRDRDYYDDRNDRRKDRRADDSPRRWRDSPKRGYDKYKPRDEDSNDEKYDKKSVDAKKKLAPKKTPTSNPGKGKLPFIGRLPLFKKKEENKPEKDITPLPYTTSKFEDTPKVPSEIINPPGVVHITKLAGPVVSNNVPASKPAMKILVAPPPPVLNAPKTPANPPQVVDMEIEDQLEETIIEDTTNDTSKAATTSSKVTPASTAITTAYSQPPPFMASNAAYVPGQQFPVRPPVMPTTMPTYAHPPPMQTAYVAPQAMPMMPMEPPMVVEGVPAEPETDKRAEGPLPEDLQEALNIIFPKDEVEARKDLQADNHIMYASMYSSMIGCVGYGPEYMDQPPPEITQAETETEAQPGPDDLKMLGIDEGDTIF